MRRGWSGSGGAVDVGRLTAGRWHRFPPPSSSSSCAAMSPEDREALMEQLGLGGVDARADDRQRGTSEQRSAPRRPRDQDARRRGRRSTTRDRERLDKSLKPEDSVLIDIDFKKDKPPRIESPGAGLPPDHDSRQSPRRCSSRWNVTSCRRSSTWSARAIPISSIPPARCCCRASRPSCSPGSTRSRRRTGWRRCSAFRKLDVKVTKLPVRKVGVGGLKPFGYDLFKDASSTFAPVTDVPVPADYIVGPGDQLNVQLFGSQNRNLRLTVGRDGRINFPGARSHQRRRPDFRARCGGHRTARGRGR